MTAFRPEERAAVEAAMETVRDGLVPHGLDPGSPGMVYLLHHRATVREIRSATGRKPRHEEIAHCLLAWARDEDDVTLYALRPLRIAIAMRHGQEALDIATGLQPILLRDRSPAVGFLEYLAERMAPAGAR